MNFYDPIKKPLLFLTLLFLSFATQASDYYWVGGTGNWSAFATHWATSSGGSVFHTQVPQSTDNVYFDANSFTAPGQTLTLDNNSATCNNMDWTGVTNNPNFAGANQTVKIYGSLNFDAGMTVTTLNTTFEATTTGKTIKTAGKVIRLFILNGIGGGWTLQDDLTTTDQVRLNNGTFNTNNKTLTAADFNSSTATVRSLLLGASVLNIATWYVDGTLIVITPGTSTINATGSFFGHNLSYYDVNLNSSNGQQIYGAGNTFRKLTTGNFNWQGANTVTDTANITGGSTNIRGTFGTLILNGNGVTYSFESSSTIGTLNLNGSGSTYNFPAAQTQTITTAFTVANGNCGAFNTMQSRTSGSQATISMATGSVTTDYVNLKDIRVQGGASFTANNAINQGNNTGWTINALAAKNLYWVGGTGNWSDGNHWALTSGGSSGGCSPTAQDNVFFDANSFSATGQAVTLNTNSAVCNDMDWTGVTNNPNFAGANQTITIYGSLNFDAGMTTSSLDATFEATTTGKTIKTAGKVIRLFILNGIGGGWTLQDDLTTTDQVRLNNGTFNTNDKTLTCADFNSSTATVRSLVLGASIINIQTWYVDGTLIVITPGTSTINATGSFFGNNLSYYDVNLNSDNGQIYGAGNTFRNFTSGIFNWQGANTITGTATITGGSTNLRGTFGTLILNGNGVTYSFQSSSTIGTLNLNGSGSTYNFPGSRTQTITSALTVASGNCGAFNTIQSINPGTQAAISLATGSVIADYVTLKDIRVEGGASFTANNAINQGNNTGWTINGLAAKNLYWVGGTGNWSDGSHWATTSGGTGGGCAPTTLDNVFFDANSFSATGQTVTLNTSAGVCNDMDWTGVTNNPTFDGSNQTVKIYGSLNFVPGMTVSTLNTSFEATTTGKTITTAGKVIRRFTLNGIDGGWTLQDDLTLSDQLWLSSGTFNTNGKTVTGQDFVAVTNSTKTLLLGSSIFNATNWYIETSSTLFTITPGTSTINLSGTFWGSNFSYYNLNLSSADGSMYGSGNTIRKLVSGKNSWGGPNTVTDTAIITGGASNISGTFGMLSLNGNNVTYTISGPSTYGTLNLNGSGSTYTFTAGQTQTITNALNITGATGGSPSYLNSNTSGSQATLSMPSGTLCTDYLRIKDMKAQGGAVFTAGPSSQDISNNTGWTFIADVPNPTVTISAPTGTNACESTPVTFTAAYTNGGLSRTYEWFVDGVSVQNSASNTYTSSGVTTGTSVLAVISAYPTACSFYKVVNANTLTMALNPATISAQPSTTAQYLLVGDAATPISITAPGTYQWYSNTTNSNSGGTLLTGETGSTYTPIAAALGTMYYYATVVNTTGCSTVSNVSGSVNVVAVLPVNFISISAKQTGADALIVWKVAAETDVQSYDVERSLDGRTFVKVANVKAINRPSGEITYRSTDVNIPSGTLFYRVKSIDISGVTKYTGIVKVSSSDIRQGFAISPNPVEGRSVNLQFRNQPEGKYSVRILTATGHAVFNTVVSHTGGNGMQILNLTPGMAKGSYLVQITSPNHISTMEKIIIR